MARRIVLVDDIDGSDATATVRFSYNGRELEIDLSDENADKFAQLLAPYLEHGRKPESPHAPMTRGKGRGTPAKQATAGRRDLGTIRQWAQQKGLSVNPRGRIKADIIKQYDEAHAGR